MNYRLNKPNAHYTISSLCFGTKYAPIMSHWLTNTITKSPHADVIVYPIDNQLPFPPDEVYWSLDPLPGFRWTPKGEAFWDILRLDNNLKLLNGRGHPVVHCDLDMIVVQDLEPILQWGETEKFDMVFSRETWGDPLPICSGLYILYPSSYSFCKTLRSMMKHKTYGTYSDQNTLRGYILNHPHSIHQTSCTLNGTIYPNNTVITIDTIVICILDMDILTRDPMKTKTQFANHINVDNVGGIYTFIRYFYERLEDLPLTCRCGKRHLGNTDICLHRKN
jgi:hypothetical protein